MSTRGIQGLYIETHNWGATTSFWKELGYEVVLETDHHSGVLVHPASGPCLFVNERPADEALEIYPIVDTDRSEDFAAPPTGTLAVPFGPTHWNTLEAVLHDPDGRHVSVQAPPAGSDPATWKGSSGT
jgi:hypothetical protein